MKVFPVDSVVTELGSDGLPVYDRPYVSADLRNVYMAFFKDGVFLNESTSLQVMTATGGMNVSVKAGSCLIQGAFGIEASDRTLQLNAASATLDRIDTIVARLDLSVAARSIDLFVKIGTAAADPVRPALTRNETVWELGLADVYVPKGITTISEARISDTRLETGRCGTVTPFAELDTTTLYNQLQAATQAAVDAMQDAIDQTTAGNLQKNKMGLLTENEIPANADLNTYTTPRTYGCTNAANVATLANCPASNVFTLFVHGNGETTMQELVDNVTGTRWARKDTGAWYMALDTAKVGDYIVSRETVSGWEVTKWSSGRMEQRRRFSWAEGSYEWSQWYTVYETSTQVGGVAYAEPFTAAPAVTVAHVASGEYSVMSYEVGGGEAATCPCVNATRPSTGDSYAIECEFVAVGTAAG